MILGGLIGAAVGNQIGSGDGRRAATVAGAVIGSAIGHDAAARRAARYGSYGRREYREARPYEVERCDVRYDEEYERRIDGYRVTYEYNGADAHHAAAVRPGRPHPRPRRRAARRNATDRPPARRRSRERAGATLPVSFSSGGDCARLARPP